MWEPQQSGSRASREAGSRSQGVNQTNSGTARGCRLLPSAKRVPPAAGPQAPTHRVHHWGGASSSLKASPPAEGSSPAFSLCACLLGRWQCGCRCDWLPQKMEPSPKRGHLSDLTVSPVSKGEVCLKKSDTNMYGYKVQGEHTICLAEAGNTRDVT